MCGALQIFVEKGEQNKTRVSFLGFFLFYDLYLNYQIKNIYRGKNVRP